MITYRLPTCRLHPSYDGVRVSRTLKDCTCVSLHAAFFTLIQPMIDRRVTIRVTPSRRIVEYEVRQYRTLKSRVRRSRIEKPQA